MESRETGREIPPGAEGRGRGGRRRTRNGFGPPGEEAFFSLLVFAGGLLWWSLFHLGMHGAAGRLLGFPAWLFTSVLLGYLLPALALAVLIREVFRRDPLE